MRSAEIPQKLVRLGAASIQFRHAGNSAAKESRSPLISVSLKFRSLSNCAPLKRARQLLIAKITLSSLLRSVLLHTSGSRRKSKHQTTSAMNQRSNVIHSFLLNQISSQFWCIRDTVRDAGRAPRRAKRTPFILRARAGLSIATHSRDSRFRCVWLRRNPT